MYKNHNIQEKDGYYITNIITGECLNYFDFIWNGSFQDICKHCHSARIFIKSFKNPNVINKLKERLVTFFKNKQRTLPPELKNYNIYQGDIETAFQEIVKEYNEKECKIQSDPFRPLELDQKDKKSLIGAPAKATQKVTVSKEFELETTDSNSFKFSTTAIVNPFYDSNTNTILYDSHTPSNFPFLRNTHSLNDPFPPLYNTHTPFFLNNSYTHHSFSYNTYTHSSLNELYTHPSHLNNSNIDLSLDNYICPSFSSISSFITLSSNEK
ncbi:hypothetical protein RclHR1_16170001 [Rhizophagus clarus]|uniref:Uncharacterized protein n=1 Tax=Rhizophagus clarus TaxID=94130 RepID=A0A2Z6QUH7_9GLOM|nr:hypothetical protein RclHR1_16170001 [Rhizophagus clarus]